LKRRETAIVNQTNNGTVLKATLGKLLRDWVGGGCICMRVYTEMSGMKVWVTTKLRAIRIRGGGDDDELMLNVLRCQLTY